MKNFSVIIMATMLSAMAQPAFPQSADKALPGVVVQGVGEAIAEDRETYVGRVRAVKTVAIQAQVDGILEKRGFAEGRLVKTGDILYQIDRAPFVAAVDKAEADLAGAKATAKNAEINLERQRDLLKKGDVSQSTVDAAVAEVGKDAAAVQAAQAELETAKINLGYTDIASPLDGRIGETSLNVGNLVDSATGTLATITSINPIYVKFFVSENVLLEKRREGTITKDGSSLDVLITLTDGRDYSSAGVIDYVDIEVQESSDTIGLRASFDNPEGVLVPGGFVTVRLKDPKAQPVVTVPQSALQLDKKGHFVFVVNDKNIVERRDIVLGRQMQGVWAVASGLKNGEKVIVQGLQKVQAGSEVNPTEAGAQGAKQ